MEPASCSSFDRDRLITRGISPPFVEVWLDGQRIPDAVSFDLEKQTVVRFARDDNGRYKSTPDFEAETVTAAGRVEVFLVTDESGAWHHWVPAPQPGCWRVAADSYLAAKA